MKSNVVRIICLALIAFFFIPFVTVSCSDISTTFNGMELVTGKEIMGESTDGNIIVILLLVLPIIVLLVSIIKGTEKFENIAGIVSSIACLVILIVMYSKITENVEEFFVSIKIEAGYYLTLLSHIAIIGVILYDTFMKKKTKTSVAFEGIPNEKLDTNGDQSIENDKSTSSEIKKYIGNVQQTSSKLFNASKQRLQNNLYFRIGFLIFSGLMLIMVIIQLSNKEWAQVFQGITLICISALMFFKIKCQLSRQSALELHRVFEQTNKFINSISISSKFINGLDKLIYLFIGILMINVFLSSTTSIGIIINMVSNICMYILFLTVIVLLAVDKIDLAIHCVVGYLVVVFLQFIHIGFYGYKYISFLISLKVLIYWVLAWYLHVYANHISQFASEKTEELSKEEKEMI